VVARRARAHEPCIWRRGVGSSKAGKIQATSDGRRCGHEIQPTLILANLVPQKRFRLILTIGVFCQSRWVSLHVFLAVVKERLQPRREIRGGRGTGLIVVGPYWAYAIIADLPTANKNPGHFPAVKGRPRTITGSGGVYPGMKKKTSSTGFGIDPENQRQVDDRGWWYLTTSGAIS